MIELRDISLKRGGEPVLSDLSLCLSQQRIGLVGDNGSGKSSLARLLNGLLAPDRGELRVYGLDGRKKRRHLPRLVGFVFQNPDHQIIFPTVEEELAFGLRQLGQSKPDARRKAAAFLAEWGRESWRNQPINELSEGQKQLVCILSVLIMQPRLLIFDEPFSSLDGLTRRALLRIIADLPQQVLMISHDLSSFDCYERLIWLHQGRVRMDGAPEQVIDAYQAHMRQSEAGL